MKRPSQRFGATKVRAVNYILKVVPMASIFCFYCGHWHDWDSNPWSCVYLRDIVMVGYITSQLLNSFNSFLFKNIKVYLSKYL